MKSASDNGIEDGEILEDGEIPDDNTGGDNNSVQETENTRKNVMENKQGHNHLHHHLHHRFGPLPPPTQRINNNNGQWQRNNNCHPSMDYRMSMGGDGGGLVTKSHQQFGYPPKRGRKNPYHIRNRDDQMMMIDRPGGLFSGPPDDMPQDINWNDLPSSDGNMIDWNGPPSPSRQFHSTAAAANFMSDIVPPMPPSSSRHFPGPIPGQKRKRGRGGNSNKRRKRLASNDTSSSYQNKKKSSPESLKPKGEESNETNMPAIGDGTITAVGDHHPNDDNNNNDELDDATKSDNFAAVIGTDRSDSPATSSISSTSSLKNNNRDLIDIAKYWDDPTFDDDEISSNIKEFELELFEFDDFLEILGCKMELPFTKNNSDIPEKLQKMERIVKIVKKIHGEEPSTKRRFDRLRRRGRNLRKKRQMANKKKRANKSPPSSAASAPVASKSVYKIPCRYFKEGKCNKGSECLYSHDLTKKRPELCKFYLQGQCGKGKDCNYMHEEFPCKFFHTNTQCFSGENCRFSHDPLTLETREILRTYLDSGTFPDEVKPYRPINHPKDWNSSNDPDGEFEFDYEDLLSRQRRVLIGPATEQMKNSHKTWQWQQYLKAEEEAYSGTKQNLFRIDDALVIKERPTLIEDDDEEVKAHIQHYYQDLLDTDEQDEMMHAQEIEELQARIEFESKNSIPASVYEPFVPVEKGKILDEEEIQLLKASALDEDLRQLPSQPFTFPAAFGGPGPAAVVPGPGPGPGTNLPPPQPVTATTQPPVPPAAGTGNFFGFNPVVPPTPGSSISTTIPEPSSSVPRDPRIRDPRLSSSSRTLNAITSPSTTNTSATVTQQQSEFKLVISNPNLVLDWKLAVVKVEPINYMAYAGLFQNSTAHKNDPRLKKFFSTHIPSSVTSSLPSSSITTTSTSTSSLLSSSKETMVSVTGGTAAPFLSSPMTATGITATTTTTTINRDQWNSNSNNNQNEDVTKLQQIRQRNSIDSMNNESNTSIISTSSTDKNVLSNKPVGSPENTRKTTSTTTAVPSYALSAIASSSVFGGNLTINPTTAAAENNNYDENSRHQSPFSSILNLNTTGSDNLTVDDEKNDSDAGDGGKNFVSPQVPVASDSLLFDYQRDDTDDEGQLKVDEMAFSEPSSQESASIAKPQSSSSWSSMIGSQPQDGQQQQIDSDTERLEIDLQQTESEGDPEPDSSFPNTTLTEFPTETRNDDLVIEPPHQFPPVESENHDDNPSLLA